MTFDFLLLFYGVHRPVFLNFGTFTYFLIHMYITFLYYGLPVLILRTTGIVGGFNSQAYVFYTTTFVPLHFN